ncbi:MAG: hypothetical protein PUP91_20830 [Rhizonema sp. PD37]|nr:hypothetical protein [Rhizonema sp. PD37]
MLLLVVLANQLYPAKLRDRRLATHPAKVLYLYREARQTQILHQHLIAKIKTQKAYDVVGPILPIYSLLRRCKI